MNEKEAKELLARYRNGLCSDDERVFIENWIGEELSNQSWDIDENAKAVFGKTLKERIDIERNINVLKSRNNGKLVIFWRSIAAAAILILFLSAALLIYIRKRDYNQQLALSLIKPGKNKAILTLANGQKISLTDAHTGQVASQSGIKISKTASGQLIYEISKSAVSSNAEVAFNTIEAPAGGQWQIILADGTHVWLNALSKLKYPISFSGNERMVELTGEGYFEVAHNKSMPFKVLSLGQTVEVLGTHFNVMAYSDEKVIKTTLMEGSVKISENDKMELLKPGQQAQVSGDHITVTDHADLEDAIAWKNGYFKFNESLESIMHKLARWYNVEIVYQGNIDPKLEFGGEISRSKNISSALKIMELTGNVHFKVDGRRVIVMQ